MNVYMICYIPAQIPYLGKMWVLRYVQIGQSNISLKYLDLLHGDTNLWKLKID